MNIKTNIKNIGEASTRDDLVKEIKYLEKEFKSLSLRKPRKEYNRDLTPTKQEILSERATIKEKLMKEYFDLYLKELTNWTKNCHKRSYRARNRKPTIINLASQVSMSRQWTSKVLRIYQLHHRMPVHGNKDKQPHNKIPVQGVADVIETLKYVMKTITTHHDKVINLSITYLYSVIKRQFKMKGKIIPMKISTFWKYVTRIKFFIISKSSYKKGRYITKRLKRIFDKLTILRSNFQAQGYDYLAHQKITIKPETPQQNKKQHKEKIKSNPGSYYQWDGGWDSIVKGLIGCRINVIDVGSGNLVGLDFSHSENNAVYVSLLMEFARSNTLPSFIGTDLRSGINPTQKGSLLAIIANLYNITIIASSNSNDKASVENSHRTSRPYFEGEYAMNNYRSISEVHNKKEELKDGYNDMIKKKPMSMLKTSYHVIPTFMNDFHTYKIEKIKINTHVAILHNKIYYQCYLDGVKIEGFPIGEFGIIGLKGNKKVFFFQSNKYKLKAVSALDVDEKTYQEGSIMMNIFDNKFNENGVLLVNKESFQLLVKNIDQVSYKRVLRNGQYKLDKLYQDRISQLRKLSIKIEEKREEFYMLDK